MENISHSEVGKCVSCEKQMKLGDLPAHIAKEHVGYFPYRCLGCGLKTTDFSLVLLHVVETKHRYTVKTRPEMERLITDMLKICVGEADVGRTKLDTTIKCEDELELIEIDDATPDEPAIATAAAAPTQTVYPIASKQGRAGGAISERTVHLDTAPSPGGARYTAAMKTAQPMKMAEPVAPTQPLTTSSQPVGKKAIAGAGGGKKPKAPVTRRKKEVVMSTAALPNPPNTPKRPAQQPSGLTPSPARKGRGADAPASTPQPVQSSPQVEVGVAKKRKAPEDLEASRDGAKRRLPELEVPAVPACLEEVPVSNENVEGQQSGFKRLFSKIRKLNTAAPQPLYSAHQFWMMENFGRIFAEGDGTVPNGQLEAISQWMRLKDKSKWERMAEEHAARQKKASN